jgi:hypothetical protein
MTSQQAQPEYIITEEQLKNLIYIVYRDGGEEKDDDIHVALKGIRPRPASAAGEAVLDFIYGELQAAQTEAEGIEVVTWNDIQSIFDSLRQQGEHK